MTTRIAIPTNDGETISRHFGQAKFFRVVTVDNGQLSTTELRPKASHQHSDPHPAGMHPGQQMVNAIADCQVLISGGMGQPAYQKATAAGLKVILTRQGSIQAALQAYLAGQLADEPQLIHQP